MPAGIAIPLIIGAISAKKSATAAKKAAKVQAEGEDQALALQKQMYDDAQARYAPYQEVARNALPTLASLAGNVQAPRYGQNLRDLSIYGQPPNMPPSPVSAPAMSLPGRSPMQADSSGQPNANARVIMRAPNGQTQAVPREQVAHYQQKGAQVMA